MGSCASAAPVRPRLRHGIGMGPVGVREVPRRSRRSRVGCRRSPGRCASRLDRGRGPRPLGRPRRGASRRRGPGRRRAHGAPRRSRGRPRWRLAGPCLPRGRALRVAPRLDRRPRGRIYGSASRGRAPRRCSASYPPRTVSGTPDPTGTRAGGIAPRRATGGSPRPLPHRSGKRRHKGIELGSHLREEALSELHVLDGAQADF